MRVTVLCAVLMLTLVAVPVPLNHASARPLPLIAPHPMPDFINVEKLSPPFEASAQAPGDSLYLLGAPGTLSGQFQDAAGLPDRQGWAGVDINQATEVQWRISTFNAAALDTNTSENHAWWCGEFFESCNPEDPQEGYGNNWSEFLEWRGVVPDPDRDVTVRIQAVISYDVEPGEDYLYLQVDNSQHMENLATYSYRGTAEPVDISTVVPAEYFGGDGGDEIHLRWSFHSDGGWSDEDCSWPTSGAAQIDLIKVFFDQGAGEMQVGSTETCEAGDPLQWQAVPPRGPGDFSKVWPLLEDADPASENDTPQFAFIDDGVVVPGTGGYPCTTYCYGPGGYIVNPESGVAETYDYVHNEIWSPVLAVPTGDWDGGEFAFDHYVHAELDNGGAYNLGLWHVRSTADPTGETGWSPWRDRNFVIWGDARYVREVQNVADLLVPGFTHVQLALGVRVYYFGTLTDGTPAPYFDNVSFKVYESAGSRSLLVRADGNGDYPTIQAALNAAAIGDTVLLADGVYSGEGNRDLNYLGKGVTVRSQSGNPRDCIIDLEGVVEGNHRGFVFGASDGTESVLSGLTVMGARLDSGRTYVYYSGGAVICRSGASPTISNCIFQSNHVLGFNHQGGAIFCADSSPLITDCVFEGNSAINGGAIGITGTSSPVIRNSLFVGNVALELGGGVYADNVGAQVAISSCTFYGNHNLPTSGTLVSDRRARFEVDHTIISLGSSGYSATATGTEDFHFTCSNIFGCTRGDWYGYFIDQLGADGNISLDPLFCMDDYPANHFTLHEDSPCGPEYDPGCGLIGCLPVACGSWSAVEDLPAGGRSARLFPCYPNPFNPRTTLSFHLTAPGPVQLRIYGVDGKLVATLIDGFLPAGRHEMDWQGTDEQGRAVASGVFFCRLKAGFAEDSIRMVLLR